jgi:type II secretory pathway component PulF
MPQFSYRARNAQGGLVEGTLNCPDRSVAIRQIEQLQCIPIRIETIGTEPQVVNGAPVATAAMAPATQRLKIPHTQLLIFTEQLAHLLQAGMTLDEGLAVLQKRLKHPRVQQMTQSLHRALVDGRSFSQALRDFPKIFPAIYVNLIAAGEASGALPEILRRLVEHLMQAKNLRDRVQQALIYPAFLAVAGAALMVIFITFMVPQLTNFMANNGGALPLPTRILVSVNSAIVGYWWLALALVVGGVIAFRAFVRSDEGRVTVDRLRLAAPGYGRIIKHRYYAQFSRTLGTLDGQRRSAPEGARSRHRNRGQPVPRAEARGRATRGDRWSESLGRAGGAGPFSGAVHRHDGGRRADRAFRADDADDRRRLRAGA